MSDSTPISKVRLPDGSLHNFATAHTLIISDSCLNKLNVTWNITNFTGTATLISGTTEDYRLNVNETRTS